MFNKARTFDFLPDLHFADGTEVTIVQETRLLGVVVSSDLKWSKNTSYICQKARKKVWMLRRMKSINLNITQMVDVYVKVVRSILEMAVPVWHSGITRREASEIESIQKLALKIILGSQYTCYTEALKLAKIETLEELRGKLCLKFAEKNLKSNNSFFTLHHPAFPTRRKPDRVKEFSCRTARFQRSSLPFLARMLNEESRSV